jgi:N-acetylmuramoyl-L-alanine amidase
MLIIPYLSPNFNDRPVGTVINTVVLHYTDLENSKVSLNILCDPKAEVSSHYLIDVDGTINQLVADEKRAWHAGVSQWRGRDNVNNFSIGIELQNPGYNYFLKYGHWDPYPLPLMGSLVELLRDLTSKYPINPLDIIGHNDVAPDRKRDPGPHFDWQWLAKKGFGKEVE